MLIVAKISIYSLYSSGLRRNVAAPMSPIDLVWSSAADDCGYNSR